MKIKFSIDYRTQWGQGIYVMGSCAELGSWDEQKAVKMLPGSGEQWEVEVAIESATEIGYKYLIKDESNSFAGPEFGDPRKLQLDSNFKTYVLKDFWRSVHAPENPLYTSPFSRAFFERPKSKNTANKLEADANYVCLQIRAPRISKDYHLVVTGSIPALGEWDTTKAIRMSDGDFPVWQTFIKVKPGELPFEYKYAIYSQKEKRIVTWENRTNRYFPKYEWKAKDAGKLIVHTDEYFHYPVGNWKAAGVAIPVFSLRTRSSAGVGEFTDIKLLVDWAVKTKMKVVQVLPVNDTVATHTWIDSYPYAAISVHALHPIYANMQAIGRLKDAKQQKTIDAEAAKLNALAEVDYEGVMNLKSRFFKLSYDENKDQFMKSKELKTFLKENESWITGYAVFSCLRDRFKTPDFTQWGEYAQITDKRLAEIASPTKADYDDIAVHYYIQYHLDKQLKEASNYARHHGVVLKGDIPIGIYRSSVDAWRNPHLYHMDSQAGAPPDDFSVSGQNWGFPTYNWEEMAKDGFAWWKERMVKMSEYFDVFRIDHILGFFRIWEIPFEYVEGLFGRFNPSLPFSYDELRDRGIHLNYDRFCKPYIRRHMVYDLFSGHAEDVFAHYLEEYAQGCYQFKEDFSTQRKVKNHFDRLVAEAPHEADFLNWMRHTLYRLHGEVLFMEAPMSNGQAFNPRIAFHSTYSYQELDDYTKGRLDELYNHYFYHRHNEFWRESAMRKLPMLKEATNMLICGEDLGMVPASVPGVMNELQILSLAIQRMPNDDREFWHPSDTPYLSVTSTGSHDMSTLREWWQENRAKTQKFYNTILGHGGEAPYFCEPWVAFDVIRQHIHSPSMLAIFPIQDFLAMDGRLRRSNPEEERINVPAISQHYWRYRLHLNMEDLLEEDGFNSYLLQMIDQGGRSADY